MVGLQCATYQGIFATLITELILVLNKTIKEQFATHIGTRVRQLRETKREQVLLYYWLEEMVALLAICQLSAFVHLQLNLDPEYGD